MVTGEPWADAPRHWLAVNGIVRECLTNAGKYAQGEKVAVTVEWSEGGVRVRALNPSLAEGSIDTGRGIPGMAERTRLLGGTFEAAYTEGCCVVTALLPATGSAPS